MAAHFCKWVIVLVFFLNCFVVFGDSRANIVLHDGSIVPTREGSLFASSNKKIKTFSLSNDVDMGLFLIHLSEQVSRSVLAAHMTPKICLLGYVPHNSFAVFGTIAELERLSSSFASIDWVGPVTASKKLSPYLKSYLSIERSIYSFEIQLVSCPQLWVQDHLAAIPLQWMEKFKSLSLQIVLVGKRRVQVIFPNTVEKMSILSTLDWISDQSESYWIEPKMEPQAFNHFARWLLQTGTQIPHYSTAYNTSYYLAGLDGRGVMVGCADSGIDYDMCYFKDANQQPPIHPSFSSNHRKIHRIINYGDAGDESGHGTHVVGTILGESQSSDPGIYLYDGIAPGARLHFMDIGNTDGSLSTPADLETGMLELAYLDGAKIHSHSWGCGITGQQEPTYCNDYTVQAQSVDQFSYTHEDSLVIFAAGNDGSTSLDGTIGSPATAKNCLSVGASSNTYASWQKYISTIYPDSTYHSFDSLAEFSSTGPTQDGRIKPDVIGPGFFIKSAKNDINLSSNNCDVVIKSGTSMATPAVAGIAAILQQYFEDGFFPTGEANQASSYHPSGSLLKAILINSGEPIRRRQLSRVPSLPYSTVIPNVVQDFVDADISDGRTFRLLSIGHVFQFSLSSSSTQLIKVVPTTSMHHMKISIYRSTGAGTAYISRSNLVSSSNNDQNSILDGSNVLQDLVINSDDNPIYIELVSSPSLDSHILVTEYSTESPGRFKDITCLHTGNQFPVFTLSDGMGGYTEEGPIFASYYFQCSVSCNETVFGTRVYGYESSICTSAIHQGVIGENSHRNGIQQYLKLTYSGPQSSLLSTLAHDITSLSQSSSNYSFTTYVSGGDGNDTEILSPIFDPNEQAGFGLVHLSQVAAVGESTRKLVILSNNTDIDHQDEQSSCVYVTSSTMPLKVTLVWADPPATLLAGIALVNDLDMRVNLTNTSTIIYPNGKDSADHLNNVEQIYIETPLYRGIYCAVISGFNIPMGPQKYALVATGSVVKYTPGDILPFIPDSEETPSSTGITTSPTSSYTTESLTSDQSTSTASITPTDETDECSSWKNYLLCHKYYFAGGIAGVLVLLALIPVCRNSCCNEEKKRAEAIRKAKIRAKKKRKQRRRQQQQDSNSSLSSTPRRPVSPTDVDISVTPRISRQRDSNRHRHVHSSSSQSSNRGSGTLQSPADQTPNTMLSPRSTASDSGGAKVPNIEIGGNAFAPRLKSSYTSVMRSHSRQTSPGFAL